MTTDLETIDRLKAEWDGLQPIDPARERRLWRKLRLEWNYHSNHIEGNTLTYGETELLLLHGVAAGNHALREYEEMKAHDAAIEYVRTLAADRSRAITEADIRDLNRIILKEPFWLGEAAAARVASAHRGGPAATGGIPCATRRTGLAVAGDAGDGA